MLIFLYRPERVNLLATLINKYLRLTMRFLCCSFGRTRRFMKLMRLYAKALMQNLIELATKEV